MNCCDEYGNCRQGRDCPIRAERVARIGRKDYAKEPLRGSHWRLHLRYLAKWLLVTLFVMMTSAMMLFLVRHA